MNVSDLGVALTHGSVTDPDATGIPANANGLDADGIPGNVNDFAVDENQTN